MQSAYEVRVGTSPGSANLWDSGRTASDESSGVPYRGRKITSSESVYWQVRVWDETGQVSRWSAISTWTAGIMRKKDWQAHWIGGVHLKQATDSLLLRREFQVHSGLKQAIVHVTGLGQYEMRVNGQKVGTDLLTPGWTDYRKTVLYDTYDITNLLTSGENAAGILLGNGMDNVHGPRYTKFTGTFGPQKAMAQIQLLYKDGSKQTLITDNQWGVHPGPITYSSVYGGEDIDLRLVPKGWDEPHFVGKWPAATEMQGPGGVLRGTAFAAPPIRTIQTLKPHTVYPLREGVETIDLGQNASIMVRFVASGPRGSRVRVIPAELIKPDHSVDRTSSGGGDAWWQITLDGNKAVYFPKFFYHGSRYVQVECSGGAHVESLEGVVVHSSAPEIGEFSCSSELFNRIHTLVRWAQRSNLVSVITDCPHRERLGWLEQYHLNGPSLRYEHDLANLYAKTVQDMEDAQLPNGLVPDIAPEFTVFGGPFRDSPEWGSSIVLVPWQQYEFNGDTSLLKLHYDAMKKYVMYLRSTASDGIVSHGLGDWYDIGPGEPGFAKNTPTALTATAFYYQDAKIVSQAAALLGKTEDASLFSAESDHIREAFNKRFFNSAKGYYASGSQTSSAIPLVMGLVESENRGSVLSQLVSDIESRGNGITSGDVGYRYVLRALADAGRSDLVFAMNNQSDKPGYGYQLKMGATSLTEAWDAHASSSQNHFMLGQIVEWLYHDLCGIQPELGFKTFRIHPAPVEGLAWAKASFRSEYGLVESSWRREAGQIHYEITVPPNSHATVELDGHAPQVVGSGRYEFN
jgi:alpha-L-rhamnosidase